MSYFVSHLQAVLEGAKPNSADAAVKGHLSVFAAEHSRLTGKTIYMDEFVNTIKSGALQ